MAPPRKKPDADAVIRAMVARGATARQIAAATGIKPRTAARRKEEALAAAKPARAASAKRRPPAAPVEPVDPPLPPSPEAIPDGADPGTIDRWIKRAEELAEIASNAGEVDGFVKMGRLSTALLEHKRKATPPTLPDPNDNPDMVALGAEVAARLSAMIDQATT